jgi:nitrate/TMAO reductase-like tetraheme cytochrome c subunit
MEGQTPPPSDTTGALRPWWWRALGVRRRPGKWLCIGLTLWGWALVMLVVVIGGGAGFAEYSMQPDFCRSCHIMEPYYQAWHRSTHNGIPCQDCHFEPGWRNTLKGKFQASAQVAKYLTRTYGSKPHAEIADASCLRSGCHERRLLEGKVRWQAPTSAGQTIEIAFDHTPHLGELRRGKQLRCVSCHSQIVQGQHLAVTVGTCFLCHFKGLRHGRDNEVLGGCRSCHDAPRQVVQSQLGPFNHREYVDRGVACENCHSDAIAGDGEVPKQVCGNCHNVAEHLGRYGDSAFVHRNHVTEHKVECSHCHIEIEHRLSATRSNQAGSCGACHEGSHGGPAALYRGTGGRGVPDMPSPMARTQVDCIACHRHGEVPAQAAEVVGQTFTAMADSCAYCHGAKYTDTLRQWKEDLAKLEVRIVELGVHAQQHVSEANVSAAVRRRAELLLADAEYNCRFVTLGHGVHNFNYSLALLNAAGDFYRRAEATIDAEPSAVAPATEPVREPSD